MSDCEASVTERPDGFRVRGYERIEYDFAFVDNILSTSCNELADCYKKWGRCLAVMDKNMFALYGSKLRCYFEHHRMDLEVHQTPVGEKAKSLETFLSIVDSMTKFGIYRKEPVLVVGGGLVTDVAGFACATYRRNTNYIRIPTTLIGLIDASVSIKVAVNYGNYKNRLGAYHAPMKTFLDFTFLRTLPEAQIRNGFAELIKISSCAHLQTFELLEQHCKQLISTGFGRTNDAPSKVRAAADVITRAGIYQMLKLETPNLHEIGLDRVIAYGHTWSPLHELVPETPLRHGHAISIDMAFSATLANMRGLLDNDQYERLLWLFSHAGLSMDHHQFDEAVLKKATEAILKTRDGLLRAAVPSPLGSCVFLNDVSEDELNAALRHHKEVVRQFPRNGEGLDAFVDASDTGEGLRENGNEQVNGVVNGHSNGSALSENGGNVNGHDGAHTNGNSTEEFHTPNGTDVGGEKPNSKASSGASEKKLPLANGSTS